MSGVAVLPFRLFSGRSSHSKATYTHTALLLNAIVLLLLMGCHGRCGGGIAMGALLTIPASNNATLNCGSDEYATDLAIFALHSIGPSLVGQYIADYGRVNGLQRIRVDYYPMARLLVGTKVVAPKDVYVPVGEITFQITPCHGLMKHGDPQGVPRFRWIDVHLQVSTTDFDEFVIEGPTGLTTTFIRVVGPM